MYQLIPLTFIVAWFLKFKFRIQMENYFMKLIILIEINWIHNNFYVYKEKRAIIILKKDILILIFRLISPIFSTISTLFEHI
jgi:hypothetical protein